MTALGAPSGPEGKAGARRRFVRSLASALELQRERRSVRSASSIDCLRAKRSSVIETWYVCGLTSRRTPGSRRLDVGDPALPRRGQVGERRRAAVGDDGAAVDDGTSSSSTRPAVICARDVRAGVVVEVQRVAGGERLGRRRQHVGGGPPAVVVDPPQPLGARVEHLDRRVRALHRRRPPPRAVVDGDELEHAVEARVAVARGQARADAEHEPADDGVGDPCPGAAGLGGDLRRDLPDRQLVELARQHDRPCRGSRPRRARGPPARRGRRGRRSRGGCRPARARPRRRRSNVAMALGMPLLEGVDGVDEQQGVVGVDVGVGVERGLLALAEGEEQLDHRVGVRAGRRAARARRPTALFDVDDGAADDRRPRRGVGAVGGGPAHAELEHRPAVRGLHDAGRLGGDQRGEVELVEQRRLQQLGRGQRALDDGDRRVGVDDPALGHGVDAQAAEVDGAEPVAERVVEQPARRDRDAVAAQRVDVGRAWPGSSVTQSTNGARPAATQ